MYLFVWREIFTSLATLFCYRSPHLSFIIFCTHLLSLATLICHHPPHSSDCSPHFSDCLPHLLIITCHPCLLSLCCSVSSIPIFLVHSAPLIVLAMDQGDQSGAGSTPPVQGYQGVQSSQPPHSHLGSCSSQDLPSHGPSPSPSPQPFFVSQDIFNKITRAKEETPKFPAIVSGFSANASTPCRYLFHYLCSFFLAWSFLFWVSALCPLLQVFFLFGKVVFYCVLEDGDFVSMEWTQ